MRWLWITLLVMACGTSSGGQNIERLNSDELAVLLTEQEVQLVDVRTPEEVSYGRIADAQHIDFYDPEFAVRFSKLDKERAVVVYCAVGGRSAQAAERLKEMGFQQVYDLSGGMRGWRGKGYPVSQVR